MLVRQSASQSNEPRLEVLALGRGEQDLGGVCERGCGILHGRESEVGPEGLASLSGVRMVLPAQPASALVAFHIDGVPPEEGVKALHGRGAYLRSLGPAGALRAATHYLTSEDDVEGLVGAVRALARSR